MSDYWSLLTAVAVGLLLGAVFFGGLWLTVRTFFSSRWAPLWFLGSMLLRTAIVLLGFYWFMADSWQKMLAGLLGFVIARMLVIRLTRTSALHANASDHSNHLTRGS